MFIAKNHLFVHIPRTGGNFIKKTLRENGNLDIHNKIDLNLKPHYSLQQIPDFLKKDKIIWTCVRNPIDHLHSFWACKWKIFLSRPNRKLNEIYESLFDTTFINFVEEYLTYSPGNLSERYKEWLSYKEDYPKVDLIIKTKSINSDLLKISKKLKIKLPKELKGKYNSSPRKDCELPKSLRAQLLDAEKDMMDTFNFEY